MTISSTATTNAVTANSVMLAPANEFAMSAPNAGPPVTWARSPAGSPSAVASRSSLTASLRANPDSSPLNGTTATAASRSAETWTGRVCSSAPRSAGEEGGAPSTRVNTRIAGTVSPPGNCVRRASARADSALAGTDTGDCSPESSPPISAMRATNTAMTTSASTQERRVVTASANRSQESSPGRIFQIS